MPDDFVPFVLAESDGELFGLLFQVGAFLFLLGIGYFVGRAREKRHLRQLDLDEAALSSILVTDIKRLPAGMTASEGTLVAGTTVVALDYFKIIAGQLRNLFGGEVRGFTTLVTRAKREAIVRMLRQAQNMGADAVFNVRIETMTVGGKEQGKPGGVECLAYGTALKLS
ncbi:MAG: YbjQ family protein [Planctomycetota bacterium]